MERQKLTISKEEFAKGEDYFTEKYGVNRSTYYRVKQKIKNGQTPEFWQHYHQKEQTQVDTVWCIDHTKEIMDSARIGVNVVFKKIGVLSSDNIKKNYYNDLISEAQLRILELSGKKEERDSTAWQIEVAKRAALGYIKSKIRKHYNNELFGREIENMNEQKMPSPDSPEYEDYFDQKYGEGAVSASKSNRKANQKSAENFMPMDGKFTREYGRLQHERDTKKFDNK